MARKTKTPETAKQVTERVLTSFGLSKNAINSIRGHADSNRATWLVIASGLAFLGREEFEAVLKIAKRARAVPAPLSSTIGSIHDEKKAIVETMVEHMVTDYVELLAKSRAERERVEKILADEGLTREDGDKFWHRYAQLEQAS